MIAWLLALGACGDLPRPFQPDEKESQSQGRAAADPRLRPPVEQAEFVVLPPKGVTDAMAERLPIAIVLALREQGIVATTNGSGAPRTIEVAGKPQLVKDELRVAWMWTVRDAKGGLIGRREQIVSTSADEWLDGGDRLISRVAARGAYHVAEMIGRADPANAPVGAQTTVLPPTEVPPAGGAPGPVTPASTTAPPPPPTPGGAPPVAAPPPPAQPAAKFPHVRVMTVTGAPGNGNRALTAGMRRALGESQIVLVDAPDSNSMTVVGSVEISPPAEGKQRIVIRWVLKGPGGAQLGDLEQANTIRAGALNGEWGGVADVIALAASEGILQLINRTGGAAPR
ncbi:MAG: hypothetical protein AB7O88_21880 [Reyranellaceae bacterium]